MIRSTLRILAALFGAGLVMTAWSEFVFYNEGPVEGLIAAMETGFAGALGFILELGGLYALPAAVALAAMAFRGAAGLGRIMLIAALVGFAIEGMLVPAVYEAVPLSYLWTSIAWHGPVTVGLGIFLMPRLLGRWSPAAFAGVSLALGALWGVWTMWPLGAETPAPTPAQFAGFAAWTTATMAAGYVLLHWSAWPGVRLPRVLMWGFAGLALILFVAQGLAHPLGAMGLAALMALMLIALARWPSQTADPEALRWTNLCLLALMPAAATGVFWAQTLHGAVIPPDELTALGLFGGLLTWVGCLAAGYLRPGPTKTDTPRVAS